MDASWILGKGSEDVVNEGTPALILVLIRGNVCAYVDLSRWQDLSWLILELDLHINDDAESDCNDVILDCAIGEFTFARQVLGLV